MYMRHFFKRNATSKCLTRVRWMFLIKIKMCLIVYKHEIWYSKCRNDELWHKHQLLCIWSIVDKWIEEKRKKERIDALWQQYCYVVRHMSAWIECMLTHTLLPLCKVVLDHHTHPFFFSYIFLLRFFLYKDSPLTFFLNSSTPMIVNHYRTRNIIVSVRVCSRIYKDKWTINVKIEIDRWWTRLLQ
jgi:hypothetical protein